MPWNEATADAELVADTVSSAPARVLLYQARANLELFSHSAQQLDEALEETNLQNFMQSQSCHMNEGIFGADKHLAEMEAAKQRTVGFLLSVLTSGHRFWRCLIGARRNDQGSDWGTLRVDLNLLESHYHEARNFMEHLDEAIAAGAIEDGMDCQFSPAGVLVCQPPDKAAFRFDFKKQTLQRVPDTYEKVLQMLEQRRGATPGTSST